MIAAAARPGAPERSAARQNLADAIASWRQAVADLARVDEAQGRLGFAWTKTAALEAARSALEDARAAEASFLVDELLGKSDDGNSPVVEAEEALRDAENDDRRYHKMFELLAAEHEAAERRLKSQAMAVELRRADVLRAEGVGEQLRAEREALFRQLAANAARWRALPGGSWPKGMVTWNSMPEADYSTDDVWSAAIEALKTDADAPLPEL